MNVIHAIITRCVEDGVRERCRYRYDSFRIHLLKLIRAELPSIHAERKKENNICSFGLYVGIEHVYNELVEAFTSKERVWESFQTTELLSSQIIMQSLPLI